MGSHLDLRVRDVDAVAARAEDAGADVDRSKRAPVVLGSPARLACCVVEHDREAVRPAPRVSAAEVLHVVDQDVNGLVTEHELLGATVVAAFDSWTSMTDTSGLPYCVTNSTRVPGHFLGRAEMWA